MHGNMVFSTHYRNHEISWNNHEISWNNYEISWNNHEISWNNHDISWNNHTRSRDYFIFCVALMCFRTIQTKDVRFFWCRNSAADILKSHTFKWGPLADEVFDAAWSSPTVAHLRHLTWAVSNSQWRTSIKYYGVVISTWSHIGLSWHEYSYGVQRFSAEVWMLWHGQNATGKTRDFCLNSPLDM